MKSGICRMSLLFMRFNQEWQSGVSGSLPSGSSQATSDSPNPWTSRLKYTTGHKRAFELIEACLQVWMSCLRLMLRKVYISRVAPMVPKPSALIAMSVTQRPHESQNITIERPTSYSKTNFYTIDTTRLSNAIQQYLIGRTIRITLSPLRK